MGGEEEHLSLAEILKAALKGALNEDVVADERRNVDIELLAAHKCSIQHRRQIKASKFCGCFHCRRIFPRNEVRQWMDAGTTAICPLCGIDSVIGDASGFPVTKDFLTKMCQVWFGYLPKEGKETTNPTIILP